MYETDRAEMHILYFFLHYIIRRKACAFVKRSWLSIALTVHIFDSDLCLIIWKLTSNYISVQVPEDEEVLLVENSGIDKQFMIDPSKFRLAIEEGVKAAKKQLIERRISDGCVYCFSRLAFIFYLFFGYLNIFF